MVEQIYNLPQITIVGGQSHQVTFDVYLESGAPATDIENCDINISLIHYANRDYALPVLELSSKNSSQVSVFAGEDGIANKILVSFRPLDTVDLSGKYIYQMIISDNITNARIPGQGIMFVTPNINKKFIKNSFS